MQAIDVIEGAYRRLNRLSPGESLSGDDIGTGLEALNLLVDELSADGRFLFRDVLTSAVQTGHITLGAGSWATIPAGAAITSMSVDGVPIRSITMEQYNSISDLTQSGSPILYCHDGLSTIYLYPVANGQTIRIQTGVTVSEFADEITQYTVPPGYKSALAKMLAEALAPVVNANGVTADIAAAARGARAMVSAPQPAILNSGNLGGNILNGW